MFSIKLKLFYQLFSMGFIITPSLCESNLLLIWHLALWKFQINYLACWWSNAARRIPLFSYAYWHPNRSAENNNNRSNVSNTENTKMMIIVIMIFRMIVVADNIKTNNNGRNKNSKSNNKYQVGLTIQGEIMIQGATT